VADPDTWNAASSAGSRATAGIAFQARVFVYWAAHATAGLVPTLGLDPLARIEAVGSEVGYAVDDLGIALSNGGFVFIQAKAGLSRLDGAWQHFGKALDQVIEAYVNGIPTADGFVHCARTTTGW